MGVGKMVLRKVFSQFQKKALKNLKYHPKIPRKNKNTQKEQPKTTKKHLFLKNYKEQKNRNVFRTPKKIRLAPKKHQYFSSISKRYVK